MSSNIGYQNIEQGTDMQTLIACQRLLIGIDTVEKGEKFTISTRKAQTLISESMAEKAKLKKEKVTNQ